MPRLRSLSRRSTNRLSLLHRFAHRFELLESRLTPAVMGLDFQLLADNNGVPGDVMTRLDDLTHNLNVNQVFWVRVLAWDERGAGAANPGVISLPLNLTWDSSVVTLLTTLPPVPVPLDNSILTNSFPLQRAVDSVNAAAGTINSLRAAALPNAGQGAAIGTQVPADTFTAPNTSANPQFSLLKFQARSTATTADSPFKLTLAGSMSFADAAGLDDIVHVQRTNPAAAPGTNNLAVRQIATNEVDVIEFLKINTLPTITSISGFVYADLNVNGVLDRDASGVPSEIGLPNVTITLTGGAAPIITKTGADGWYHFENLVAGTYTITETQPAHFVEGPVTAGLVIPPGVVTPVARGTVGANQISGIQLNTGDTGVDYNFGERPIPTKLNFLTSTDSRSLLAKNLGVTAATFTGAMGGAEITVNRGTNGFTVVQGGTTQTFAVQMLTVDAQGANVLLNGTTENEDAHLWRGQGTLRFGEVFDATHYAMLAVNATGVSIDPGAGNDRVVLDDSPATDALTATGAATLELRSAADAKFARAVGFETVRVVSPAAVRTANTDTDTITSAAANLVDQVIGDWTPI